MAIFVTLGLMAAACARSPAPAALEPLSVCDALASAVVGQTVAIRGEFNGFGYAPNSRSISLVSDDVCSARGAGLVFAEMTSRQEAERFARAKPRPKRGIGRGDTITVQGKVSAIKDARRTMELVDAIGR